MRLLLLLLFVAPMFGQEVFSKKITSSVDTAVKQLSTDLKKKGITIFATVDHKKNATQVKLTMLEAKLIIFGNPVLGTALMNDNMEWSYDLPLRIAVYKDKSGNTWVRTRLLATDINTPKEKAKIDAANNLLKSLVNSMN